jgi:hypothetical protein
MTQQLINIGLVANDQGGDTIRVAFNKVNANFTDVYSQLGTAIQTLLPSQTGHGGLFLATTGTGLVWAAPGGGSGVSLPLQTGQAGNYLVTNGTTASWSPISVSASASSLVGTTLAANVIASSLTSVGTLASLSVSGNTTIGGNTTIAGNLSVTGTVTTVNQANLTVTNPLIFLAQGNTGNSVDIGLVGTYNSTKYAGIVKHAADGLWYLFSNDADAVTTTINPTSITKDSLVANLVGNVTGNVSGNAGTVSNGVYTYNSYNDPSWIASLNQTKVLPTQGAGTTNYVLTSNGTTAGWTASYAYTLPTAVAGTSSTGTLGGVIPDGTSITITNGVISTGPGTLPSQSGSGGKYLTTDGASASWANPLGSTTTYIGTNSTTNSTVNIYGNTSTGTATLATNVTSGTANVFAGVTGTVNIGASAGTVSVGKLTVSGTTTLAGSLTGVLKAASGVLSTATAGTDYLAPPSGTNILKAASGGALANAVAGTDYSTGTSSLATGIVKTTTSTGALSIAVGSDINTTFGSQTQNYVYAAPSGANGSPTFRALALSDLPSGVLSTDPNNNFSLNNVTVGLTSTVSTGSGTVTLTVASSAIQILTGSLGHNYTLPSTGALAVGHTFYFSNTSSAGSMVIKNYGGATLATIPYGGDIRVILTDKGTANGTWDQHSGSASNSTWGSGALTLGADLVGTGTTQNIFNTTATTVNFAGAGTTINIGAITGTTTINNNLTVTGNLDIKGTTSYIESTTVQVLDKNIEIGKVASPTDTTADGGGITLLGATNKTIAWDQANNNWTSSENWNIATGKVFKINNVSVLGATALGSGVTGSSLTSVGTIGTGVWNGTVIGATYGGTGVNNGSNTLTLAGNVSYAGAYTQTFTATANTSVTLPTTGTLATLAGSEALSNKTITASTYNGLTVTSSTGTLTIAALKTFTVNNSITLAGTDSTTITLPATTGTVALNNQVFYLGTTSVAINRASASLTLTGITSIDGYAAGLAGGNTTTLLGALPYQSAANTTTLLSPNTTATKNFLTQTGNGTNGAAPSWGTLAAADIPAHYIGTTSITFNRTSATQSLTGVNIDGSAASATKATNLVGGNTTTLLGSIGYQSGTDTTTLLGPNTTTTKKFLRMTGDGTNGAAPAWDTLVAGDIPSLTSAQLATILSDETGTGVVVFATAPTFTTSIDGGSTFTAFASPTILTIGGSATTVTKFANATSISMGSTTTSAQTINWFTSSTGASTYNFATGPTLSATTKAINIGTAGVSGSTTNIAIGSTVSGATSNLTFGGAVADATLISTAKSVGYLGTPINTQAGTYTLVIGDAGKTIYAGGNLTIPANGTVAFPIGTIINVIASAGITIAITSDTLQWGGQATSQTGTRTVAAYGMASLVKATSTIWYISGAGVT